MLSKAALHKRTLELGECRSLSFEERSAIRGKWACRMSRERTAVLLRRFSAKPATTAKPKANHHHEPDPSLLVNLDRRRQTYARSAQPPHEQH